jgi:GMP synthase-like glutamine amidotransferase
MKQPTENGPSGGVLIVDFGAQYCQLIARRVRELGVYSRITVPERAMFTLQHMRPDAIVLSGGPRSTSTTRRHSIRASSNRACPCSASAMASSGWRSTPAAK